MRCTSKLVQVQYPCHVCPHDVFGKPVIGVQQPGVVLLNKLSVLCIRPEPVLPSRMHVPVEEELVSCHSALLRSARGFLWP